MIELRKLLLIIFSLVFYVTPRAQRNYTISGTISDSITGETIIGATITVKEQINIGTFCNKYGFFSLTLPKGNYNLLVQYTGYKSVERYVVLQMDQKLDFKLMPVSDTLKEVIITAEKRNENITEAASGVTKLEMKEVKKIPVLFGEQNILRTLQLTPGVKSLGEGNGGMYVRGGDNSQNLILLDEATVYNAHRAPRINDLHILQEQSPCIK